MPWDVIGKLAVLVLIVGITYGLTAWLNESHREEQRAAARRRLSDQLNPILRRDEEVEGECPGIAAEDLQRNQVAQVWLLGRKLSKQVNSKERTELGVFPAVSEAAAADALLKVCLRP